MYLRSGALFTPALFLLAGCGWEGGLVADPTEAPEPALPSGASPDWYTTVQARMAAEARAIHSVEGAFVADLHTVGLSARLDGDGVVVSGDDGAALSLRTTGWGRAGALLAVGTREPTFGACTGQVDPTGACIRRLEYVDGALTEWWVGLDTGLEQGWTLDRAPDGAGPVVVTVGVDALVVDGPDDVTITDDDGREWSVGDISAWDADGEPLPARVVATDDGLRVEVDDDGARYPIEIDPVYTTAAWTSAGGIAYNYFGQSVAGAGDVNGDGYDDVIVGAGYRSSYGGAFVFHGSATGLSTTAATELLGDASGGYFGWAVDGAGDVNADGYDDVIVGASGYGSSSGRVYVFHGSASGVTSTAVTTLDGVASSRLGTVLSGAGDVNGDGYADVVVGAFGYGGYVGRAYVFHGSATGVATTVAQTLTNPTSSSYFAYSVDGGGDVNNDGYADVVIGSYVASRVYVYQGSSAGIPATPSTTLSVASSYSSFGYVVANAGDTNGDGYDDVAAYASGGGVSVFVFRGSATGVAATSSTTLVGTSSSEEYATTIAGVGDLNNDGYDDVAVGGHRYSTSYGRVYVYSGAATGLSTTATTINGSSGYYLGGVVAGAGDVNGDHYADLIAGQAGLGSSPGHAWLYQGSATGVSTSVSAALDGSEGDSAYRVAGAGDVNADGYDDVIVGASGYLSYTGRAYVYQGSASGLATTASTVLEGTTSSYFGTSASGAGDVDADGYDDVIVGAYVYGGTGRAYVYRGGATGLSTTASTTLEGSSSSFFGFSVARAGDVNADGFDDVIVGAFGYSSSTGRAYIYPGSASGVTTTALTTFTGASANNNFGQSVAGVGDVNHDGYDDVAVGAYGTSSGAGSAYVYAGAAAGPSATATTTFTGATAYDALGISVAGAGDVDGDGYDDVIVGANGAGGRAGAAYLYRGSATGLSTTPATTLAGAAYNDSLGAWVAGAGDVNGDGYDDVVVGASGVSSYTGAAYLYEGTSTGLSSTSTTTLTASNTRYFGARVAGLGDVNGDGYADVGVGSIEPGSGGAARVYLGYAADDDGDGVTEDVDCDDTDAAVGVAGPRYVDADGDGYGSTPATVCPAASGYANVAGDCDDAVAAVSPSADEACDTSDTDEDCDGLVNDDDPSVTGTSSFYADVDGDGYGGSVTVAACVAPSGYGTDTSDCNDADAAVHPGVTETCNTTDDDCDGVVDQGTPPADAPFDAPTWYVDADGDGDGSASTSVAACDAPSGYVASPSDCDDTSASVYLGAPELVADGIDQDCDTVDTCYTDSDDDNYGTTVLTDGSSLSCATGTGAAVATDCDDTSSSTWPGAAEVTADGIDQDCDSVDSCYTDTDGDNFGTTVVTDGSSLSCSAGTGAAVSTDCDDTSGATNPTATEACNGLDDDCDGLTDDASAVGQSTWYADADGDAYGSTLSVTSCDAPVGYVADNTDCDDASAATNPAATEACNGTDDDCDGRTDDASAVGQSTWYIDADADGYGSTPSVTSCDAPVGYVADATDCDDTLASTHPEAAEGVGDAVDSDCDGGEICRADADDDGYRPDAGSIVTSLDADCSDAGEALASAPTTDCDDTDASVNPAAAELPGDAIDQDCDGAESCYVDTDLDGARTTFVVASADAGCSAPGEALATADLDCDDTDASAYPGARELPGTGVDEDCDGLETCYVDGDGDGFRPDATSTAISSDGDCDDAGEALASALTGDCDDTSTAYNPAATEADCADPNDYDCDGSVGYADADADGFAACEECDDGDSAVFPGAVERTGDGLDSDCDGADRCYVDADDDGYRPDSSATVEGTVACDASGEARELDPTGDCADADATIHPGAIETVGDAVDVDCDGTESCFEDADGDGYRSEDGSVVASDDDDCSDAYEALAVAGVDCDDLNDTIHPSATDVAGDEVDADCDGTELCYVDADADGVRPDATSTVISADASCADAGEATASAPTGDCDDTDATVNPDGVELAGDAIDSDCDGTELCYADADDDDYLDGSGVTIDSVDADCDDVSEALASALTGDCDDADAAYHPGAEESDCADPNDYNCDGSVGYADTDGDGFAACEECDDNASAVFPGAAEGAGDLVDSDCDGVESCYVDVDDDGYRPDDTSTMSSTNVACDGAGEAVEADAAGDCDDADSAVNPGATELAGDGYDQDCDGTELCFVDADGDGYTPDGVATVISADIACDGAGEATADAEAGDCDDALATFNPGATEVDCTDPADYNCDGSSGYADADADGYPACEECDDAANGVNPDAEEVCNDVDDDCDGTIDVGAVDAGAWYADADADGYTDPAVSLAACDAPEGYLAATEDDCDDADATSHPDATDIPGDGIDQDCDGADVGGGDDTGEPDTDEPVSEDTGDRPVKDPGCGCASTDTPGAVWLLFGLSALALRRRSALRD